MTSREMVYQFKLQAQRVDSKRSTGLKLAQIVIYLNMGMGQLLMTRYGANNAYQATLEEIQKRIDEWQRLIISHEDLDMVSVDDERYAGDISKTKQKYQFLLRVHFLATKDKCVRQKLRSTYSQSDDLNVDLDNPDANPNFEWRETVHRLSEDKLIAYTDRTFSIDLANIDYLRYPVNIDISGYTHFDGSSSADVDCELPEFLHPDIINEAILCFTLGQNQPGVQAAAQLKQIEE